MLWDTLKICAPLMPVKGYTLDMPTNVDNLGKNLVFKDFAITAVQLEEGMWKCNGFGDL